MFLITLVQSSVRVLKRAFFRSFSASNAAIWSPAVIDSCGLDSAAHHRSATTIAAAAVLYQPNQNNTIGGSSSAAHSAANCYPPSPHHHHHHHHHHAHHQNNYSSYYSPNMDYPAHLTPTTMSHAHLSNVSVHLITSFGGRIEIIIR